MTKKFKRYNFSFPTKIADLLEKLKEDTDLSYTVIVRQALELLAESRKAKND